ncbi:transposase [Rhizobium leguminosarum]|nr:transposase [Rhizobium leguminosarum]
MELRRLNGPGLSLTQIPVERAIMSLGCFCLIGKRFAPRLRNIKDRKFHTFEKPDAYPALINHIGAPINTALIMEHWDELGLMR